MENYTASYKSEEPNINSDDLDGFDFRPATDDEFSDLLPAPADPIEISVDSSQQEVRDMYAERLEEFFERLEEIRNYIDDDESAEIWHELSRRAKAGIDLGDHTDSAGLILHLNHLEECYRHLVSDIIFYNQTTRV